MKKAKDDKQEKLLNEINELKDSLQRVQADFVNYRRRNEEEKANFVKFAQSRIIEEILPVMDNFALAARHVPVELEANNWTIGIQAIEKQLEQIMSANGVEKVETEGKIFDPNIHEAISKITDKKRKNHEIIREEAAGYMLNGKLLRPAKVIVNNIEDKHK
jgi:molecular chaperone GrpE